MAQAVGRRSTWKLRFEPRPVYVKFVVAVWAPELVWT
jgi:hypothetical protein